MSHTNSTPPATSSLLRAALYGNAIFSAICALITFADGPQLAAAMGLSSALILYAVGAGLLPFAISLVLNARRPEVRISEAKLASLGDFGWVAGSLVLSIFFAAEFTGVGLAIINGVALVVFAFGLAQFVGIRRSSGRIQGAAA